MCNYGLGRYSRRLRMFCPGGSFYRSICRKRTDYRCGADPQTNGVTKDSAFAKRYQRAWTEEDVVELNRLFEKHLFASLENYTDPIPGVIPTLEKLRAEGLKIGSTTGYTREMMNVVLPAAQAKGYRVDYCATPNLLPAGRPAPYMIFENLIKLGVDSLDAVVKVGDTIADIKEGVNAKVCSVGVVLGSNEMALTEAETKAMPAAELEVRIADVKERMFAAGASYVILSMEELPALIERMNADR